MLRRALWKPTATAQVARSAATTIRGFASQQQEEQRARFRRAWFQRAFALKFGAACTLFGALGVAACKSPDTPDYLLPYYLRDTKSRFNHFASIREKGNRYMTPQDFVQAILALKTTEDFKRDDVADGLAAMFTACDANNDGRISFQEYSYLTILLVTSTEDFERAFRMWDTDNVGALTRSQYKKMIISFGDDSMKPRFRGGITRAMVGGTSIFEPPPPLEKGSDAWKKNKEVRIAFANFKRVVEEITREVRKAEFRMADVDRKGYITPQEFGHLLTDGGIQGRHLPYFIVENLRQMEQQAAAASQAATSDGDDKPAEGGEKRLGKITLETWLAYNEVMKQSDALGQAIQIFTCSGSPLRKKDFSRAVGTLRHISRPLTDPEVQLIFDIFDKDRDGALEFDEFMSVVVNKAKYNVVSKAKDKVNVFVQAFNCTKKALEIEQLEQ